MPVGPGDGDVVRTAGGEADRGEDHAAAAAVHRPAGLAEGAVGGDGEVGQGQLPADTEVADGVVEGVVAALQLDRGSGDAESHVGQGGGVAAQLHRAVDDQGGLGPGDGAGVVGYGQPQLVGAVGEQGRVEAA